MRLSTTPLMACALLLLTACASKNEFVGQWQVTTQCLYHESELGHGDQKAAPVHLDGTYSIAKRGESFVLQPESGAFKDEFSNCELKYNAAAGRIADGEDFDCDSFNPGAGAMNLSGTCDLVHSAGPTPHAVQVFLVKNSALYDGGTNPVITYGHPGPAHAGWLH